MNYNQAQDDSLLALAGGWHARLQHAPTDGALNAEFEHWLARDLRHRLAYADVCAAAYALEQGGEQTGAGMELPLASGVARGAGRPRWAWLAGGALSCALLFFLWQGTRPWDRIRSDAYSAEAQVKTFDLPDGSRVWLAGDSALAFDFTATARNVRVLRGEAFFDVEPDPSRPFAVRTGEVSATALGTRYAVAHRPGKVIAVEVEEGRVAVRTPQSAMVELVAGQRLHIDAQGTPGATTSLENSALAWREGLLVLEEMSLSEALERLDPYLPGRVVLLGHHPQRISAAIAVNDARAALYAIAAREGLRVDSVPGVLTVVH